MPGQAICAEATMQRYTPQRQHNLHVRPTQKSVSGHIYTLKPHNKTIAYKTILHIKSSLHIRIYKI